ncbi:uncharacterized protein [Coffea arabica]|uniref:Uncharacterized protein n=1 Tax=Coffea arabica TaxID=13443 RepID=A0ABM4VU75_COFAR
MTLRSGKEVEGPKVKNSKSKNEEEREKEIEEEGHIRENPKVTFTTSPPIKSNLSSFPCRLEKTKKAEKKKEFLNVFRKVEINIPLLDAINQIPKYAKFLKDLCTHKRKLRGDERVAVGENISAILQRKLPLKCGDPDFYVLDMGDERSLNPSPILLGKPFLSTIRTKIDVNEGTLSMEFDEEMETFELGGEDALAVALAKNLELGAVLDVEISNELCRTVEALHSLPPISPRYELVSLFVPKTQTKFLHSVVQAPELELKPLPKHLKYAFLGDKETLPVIISAHLSPRQEDNLIRLLRDHMEAIGWSIADIKGINPSLCMHRIRLEDDAKPVRQAQLRLNPLIMEVVKKEILKLLEVGMIFAISDSP